MGGRQLRHKSHIAVYLILKRGGKVLLARRANTGYADGKHSLIAGHVEGRDSLIGALCQEAREEGGITLARKHISLVHMVHRNSTDKKIYLDIFFSCSKWSGKVRNMEPHKCDKLSWYPITKLPKTVLPYVKIALLRSTKKNQSLYRERGF